MKRVMRLLPPWIFGGLLFSFSQMGFMNKEFTVDYFFLPPVVYLGSGCLHSRLFAIPYSFANVSNGR